MEDWLLYIFRGFESYEDFLCQILFWTSLYLVFVWRKLRGLE